MKQLIVKSNLLSLKVSDDVWKLFPERKTIDLINDFKYEIAKSFAMKQEENILKNLTSK